MNVGDHVNTPKGNGKVLESTEERIVIELIDGEHAGEQHIINILKAVKPTKTGKTIKVIKITLSPEELSTICSPKFLACLAISGKFTVEAPPARKDSIRNLYENHTDGSNWNESMFGSNTKKWGINCRIHIHVNPDAINGLGIAKMVTPASSDHKKDHDKNMVIINNNDLWWHLIDMGFRMGREHDVDTIMASLTVEQTDGFIEEYVQPSFAA